MSETPNAKLTCSQELRALANTFSDRPARVEDVLTATRGRGFYLLLLLISLPFITPIPLPGLSTPFGVVVAMIGARLAMGQRPWLPKRLLRKELPPHLITRILGAAGWVLRWLEVLLRPRLHFLHEQLVFRRVAGVLIMLSGLLLLLPLPIPFSNTLPALTVVFLAAGALERDGLFFLAGCAMFAAALVYFSLLAFGGVHVLGHLTAIVLLL